MNKSVVGWVVAGLAILGAASRSPAGTEADYKALFGEEEQKVVAGADAKASGAFAAKLLDAARAVDEQKAFQVLLWEKAYEFGIKDPSGYQTAIDAMKLLIETAPDMKSQAQEKLLEASQLRYAGSTGAERKRLGEEVVGLLIACGDERVEAKKPTDAVALYRKALSIATSAGSGRTAEISEKIKQATSGVEAEEKLATLKSKLRDNPKSIAARTDLILAYLGEFDRPAEAVKLLNDNLDEKFRTYVPLSAKPVGDLEEPACLELATWFAEIADKASPAGKGVLLDKSKACCERYLDRHTVRDAGRLKGTMLLEKVTKAGAKDGLSKEITLDLGKGVTMKLVLIPAGKFMMGSPDGEKGSDGIERPQREVTISKAFYMGVYEVTQEQYEAAIGRNPSYIIGAKRPVVSVSWNDAVEFCKALSAKTGKTVRLPTEAQWEYACRAGTRTRFCFGDKDADLGDYAWYLNNTDFKDRIHPVGQKKPNAWGLYDMHGNVWELCSGFGHPYRNAGTRDPQGPDFGRVRVWRGGASCDDPEGCRSARRTWTQPDEREISMGFRVVVVEAVGLVIPPAPRDRNTGSSSFSGDGRGEGVTGVQPSKGITLDLGKDVTMKLTLIPAGKFVMGSPDSEKDHQPAEGPQNEVTISTPFYMGVYEVTQEQYEALMGKNPTTFKGKQNPVERVSWDDAEEFCKALSAKTGKTVRLPTEAQWEYACRAGSKARFGYGDKDADLSEYAWCKTNSGGNTHPVGQKKPNAWGLYDMHGNVNEWCVDCPDYEQGWNVGTLRTLRGGSFLFDPASCRSASRVGCEPDRRIVGCGLRVAVDLK